MPISTEQMVQIEQYLAQHRGQAIPGTTLFVGAEMVFNDQGWMDPQECTIIRYSLKSRKVLIRVACRDYRWVKAHWILRKGDA